MKLTQRLVAIFTVILACVVGGSFLVLTADNARAQTFSVPQPKITYEIPINPSLTIAREPGFAAFAWQAFVALNWPADCKDGSPLEDKTIGEDPDAPRVWEFYNFTEDIFLPNGAKPRPKPVVPPQCLSRDLRTNSQGQNTGNQPVARSLRLTEFSADPDLRIEKITTDPSMSILVPGHKPLVDRAGNYIINEVRMNPVEVKEILANRWYAANNLQDFNNTDNKFALVCSQMRPGGVYDGMFPCTDNDTVGAIEIKAAWKVLPDPVPEAVKAKYYTTRRTFTVEDVDEQEKEVTVSVGLVGFHIMQKTSQQGWSFATFEQVDNAPDASALPLTGSYTLYDPGCTGEYCETNTSFAEEPYLWRDEFPHAVTKTDGQIEPQIPSQITRLISITQVADTLNAEWQNALASSVWKNYQLIGTQWLGSPTVPYDLQVRDVQPRQGNQESKLANVTLEPYVQTQPPIGTSCVPCHTRAMLPRQNEEPFVFADFDFLMNEAQFRVRKSRK